MTKKIKYKQKVVFFIDILGFKKIIEGKPPREIIDIIDDILMCISLRIKRSKKITQFSDSFVISFDYDDARELLTTLVTICLIQENLLQKYNILLRGGCAIGELYHTKKYVFGPAINEAYQLEHEISNYPRIIISDAIIEEWSKYFSPNNTPMDTHFLERKLTKDTDGFHYIDYISYIDFNKESGELNEYWANYMSKIKPYIIEGSNHRDLKIRQKYDWLKDKYNHAYDDFDKMQSGKLQKAGVEKIT